MRNNLINQTYYHYLRTEIEQTFGKKINSAGDCVILSEEIYSKISFKVNSNTLRRFFGLVATEFSPSYTTLDILSKYCGFGTFDEFTNLRNKASQGGNVSVELLLHFFMQMFQSTPVKNSNDKAFCFFTEETIRFLKQHPSLVDTFQRAISRTKNGQDFYFEQFINLDELNSHFGEGLRYYLLEKKTNEAQVFGHSLLALRSWFCDDPAGVRKHYEEMLKHPLTSAVHPTLAGRSYATRIIYADSQSENVETLLQEMRRFHSNLKNKLEEHRSFPWFEFQVAPVLFMTGHLQESLYYIDYTFQHYPQKHSRVNPNLYQTMNLTKALTLAKTGHLKEAEDLYRLVHPARFHFLLKKTNTIQYCLLSRYLNKNDGAMDEHLTRLIADTGFKRLGRL